MSLSKAYGEVVIHTNREFLFYLITNLVDNEIQCIELFNEMDIRESREDDRTEFKYIGFIGFEGDGKWQFIRQLENFKGIIDDIRKYNPTDIGVLELYDFDIVFDYSDHEPSGEFLADVIFKVSHREKDNEWKETVNQKEYKYNSTNLIECNVYDMVYSFDVHITTAINDILCQIDSDKLEFVFKNEAGKDLDELDEALTDLIDRKMLTSDWNEFEEFINKNDIINIIYDTYIKL